MKNEKRLSLAEYIQHIVSLSGMKLDDCYHTQDSVLRFLLTDDSRRMVLILEGNWKFQDDKENVYNSSQNSSETDTEYYQKLRSCASYIKENVSSIRNFSFDDYGEKVKISFDNGWTIDVNKNKFGLLSYHDEITEEYLIYSVDEESNLSQYYLSKL